MAPMSPEAAALHAVIEDNHEEAQRIVDGFLPGEKAEFAKQLDQLRNMLTDRFGNIRVTITEL